MFTVILDSVERKNYVCYSTLSFISFVLFLSPSLKILLIKKIQKSLLSYNVFQVYVFLRYYADIGYHIY